MRGRRAGHFIWSCGQCDGQALTIATLRECVEATPLNSLWGRVCEFKGVGSRSCPACRKPMAAIPVVCGLKEFVIDACKRCQFFWFDTSEYEELPMKPEKPLELETKVSVEAHEAIALWKAKEIGDRARRDTFSDEGPGTTWQAALGFLGIPVEMDNPIQIKPWATWLLAAVILCVSIMSFSHFKQSVAEFGLIPAQASRSGGITLITSFFLHGGIAHLLGNLYFLLIFGDNVEEFLGRTRYLLLILAATIAGAVLHIIAEPKSMTPCIGASGGISGLIVFYALQFPEARIGFMWRWFYRYRWFSISAFFALVLWGVQQGLGAWLQLKGFSNVSAMAHIGGALTGLIFWFFLRERAEHE